MVGLPHKQKKAIEQFENVNVLVGIQNTIF